MEWKFEPGVPRTISKSNSFHYYKRQLKNKQEISSASMFAEVSFGFSASITRTSFIEHRLTLYVQGMKLVILDDFQSERLLSFLRAVKQL